MAADAAATSAAERLVVGLVRGLHGLRGAVRVEVLTDDPARFEPGSVVYREGDAVPLTVTWVQEDPPGLLVRFREVTTRTGADSLRDRYLEADAPAELPEGAYYWHQVIGSRVVSTDGCDLGTVEDVFRAGEGEVFVSRGSRYGEVLVPAVRSIVADFSPERGEITVDRLALGLEEERTRRPRGRRASKAAAGGTSGGPAAGGPEAG